MSAVQLGLDKKPQIAWRLAAAAALMEYIYAWLAVKFEAFISAAPFLIRHFQLIAALVMLILGALALRASTRPSAFTEHFYNSGFRRGLALGILNPLAMPFWLAVVAYCKTQHWIRLDTAFQFHSFLAGVSAGVFCLLVMAAYLAQRLVRLLETRQSMLKKIPAFIMLTLGGFALVRYFVQ